MNRAERFFSAFFVAEETEDLPIAARFSAQMPSKEKSKSLKFLISAQMTAKPVQLNPPISSVRLSLLHLMFLSLMLLLLKKVFMSVMRLHLKLNALPNLMKSKNSLLMTAAKIRHVSSLSNNVKNLLLHFPFLNPPNLPLKSKQTNALKMLPPSQWKHSTKKLLT